MLPENTIQNELQALGCTSLANKLSTPYKAPAGYFNALAVTIVSQLVHNPFSPAEELSGLAPMLAATAVKQSPYKVPEHYFDNLAGEILQNIDKLPVLEQPLAQNKTAVPTGYFDTLADNILTKVKAAETPVVPLQSRKRNWIKYAAAAVLIGLITLTGINFFTSAPPKEAEAVATTVDIQVSKALQSVPENALEGIVNTLANDPENEKTAPVTATVSGTKNDALVAGLLNEVSTNELANFLNAFGEEADDEVFSDLN
jgi:hypothetical protein